MLDTDSRRSLKRKWRIAEPHREAIPMRARQRQQRGGNRIIFVMSCGVAPHMQGGVTL
jgi:hypothetical protein